MSQALSKSCPCVVQYRQTRHLQEVVESIQMKKQKTYHDAREKWKETSQTRQILEANQNAMVAQMIVELVDYMIVPWLNTRIGMSVQGTSIHQFYTKIFQFTSQL